jgi:hypothetical protein
MRARGGGPTLAAMHVAVLPDDAVGEIDRPSLRRRPAPA